MTLKRTAIAAGLALAGIIATSAASFAAPAVATGSVNVRTGPSTSYRVVDTLRPGERVEIEYCQGSWCNISRPGPDGWVSASYLARGGAAPRPPVYRPAPPRPPIYRPAPPRYWDGYDRRDRRWDDRWDRRWDNRWDRNQVCFGGANARFCVSD
ncbi:Uncharacterized conserved protein YraI [Devosia enhydra]|uniref:Uncharacterized conserved protein YraI n=1 Tax=Devosia enhydra TaxID=665118 RepID=A0A1K2HTG3_9HYPH|nr:SH3 domain-containing protein [Devosia enhydra]SFZ81403.1 Uncharacterized conserved protein YraI [Devosia enhydra]